MDLKFRYAEKEDCMRLSELASMASYGVVDYLFRDLIPGLSPVEILAASVEQDEGYNSTLLAQEGQATVGISLSYPSEYHGISKEMEEFFPADRLLHLNDFYSSRVDNSWYIDSLAVDPKYRRKGVAISLLEETKKVASKSGFNSLSLITFAENSPAINLYNKFGFQIIKQIKVEGNEYITNKNGCLLLKLSF